MCGHEGRSGTYKAKAMMTELDSDRDRSGEKRCVFESEVQECRRARRGGGGVMGHHWSTSFPKQAARAQMRKG